MKEYSIRSGFSNQPRKLVLADDYLEWENGTLKGQEFTRLERADIVDFRRGMDWIVWYEFTVGRRFSIAFKDIENNELRIQFSSYFGLHKENTQKFSDITDDIWRLYLSPIVSQHLDHFYDHGEIGIRGVKMNSEGVALPGQRESVPWDKVAIKDYYRYFAIYNKDRPDINHRVSWNE